MQFLNSHLFGLLLAVAALAVGAFTGGWKGALLGLSVVVFWLLLQFNRTMRVLRAAGASPVGLVPSAVMFHARLKAGLKLLEVVEIARALGRKTADAPETWVWADEAGDRVVVQLADARVTHWTLERAAAPAADVPPPAPGA